MQTKAVNHPIQRFHRTHRTPFRLLLTCAALVISGCATWQPDIYAIAPDLCTRHQVSVGDLIVTYKVGSTTYSMTDYNIRSGKMYYNGIEDFSEILSSDYTKIGEDGEAYIQLDQFFIVVYSASPEELDYALQASRATWSSWEPVPCPEP